MVTIKCTKWLGTSKGAVESQRDEHQEKYDGPEDRSGHGGDGFRVYYEYQPRTFQSNFLDAFILDVCHVAKRGIVIYIF